MTNHSGPPPTITEAIHIDSIAADGATQMAIDHALLSTAAEDRQVRFRFYTWSEPTVSLGYFQDYQVFFDEFPDLTDLAVVRRLTGGGGIIHDQEITYCLAVPCDHWLYRAGPVPAYRLIHQAIIDVAGRDGVELTFGEKTGSPSGQTRGPAFCFARNYATDLKSRLGKVVGSAQRRLKHAMLQHGSIIFENRFQSQPAAGLNTLAGKALNTETFNGQLLALLAERLHVQFSERSLSHDERASADHLRATVHATDEWIHLGRKRPQRTRRPGA